MSIDIAEKFAEDRRLVILRALADAPGNTVNHYVLKEQLAQIGHRVSHDTVQADLLWLMEQRLITAQTSPAVWVATITGRGLDVSTGDAIHPGVKRPIPGL